MVSKSSLHVNRLFLHPGHPAGWPEIWESPPGVSDRLAGAVRAGSHHWFPEPDKTQPLCQAQDHRDRHTSPGRVSFISVIMTLAAVFKQLDYVIIVSRLLFLLGNWRIWTLKTSKVPVKTVEVCLKIGARTFVQTAFGSNLSPARHHSEIARWLHPCTLVSLVWLRD